MKIALTVTQIQTVADIAARLPAEKRGSFLDRLEARLIQCSGQRLTDWQVSEASQLALASLMAHKAAV